jgi:tRNA U34 2-thiouridine synthase MnmA/TrmU
MKKNEKKVRALVLMSGGLDSMLAAKILEQQGIEVTPVCFESHFFGRKNALKAAQAIGMDLRAVDISGPHLEIVKHPRYGHGGAVNPCIDCHLLMLKTAKAIMDDEGYDFVATGEVLGERPMSQNKLSLDIVERESGLAGLLLRPLSAKLMPSTFAEIKGLVDRSKLYDISGRSREPQMRLARKFGITHIPQPGGGCILTEDEYGRRLKKLIEANPDFDGSDAQILRRCRPIWESRLLFAVARNKEECAALKSLAKSGDYLIEPQNFSGPVVLARNFGSPAKQGQIEESGKKHLLRYSKKVPQGPEILIEKR